MTWLDQDSIWRDRSFSTMVIIPIVSVAIGLLCLHYLFFEPFINQMDQEIKDKTQNEHNKLLGMDCKELGNWLLQDDVYSHDNLIWAQNHYLVNCK